MTEARDTTDRRVKWLRRSAWILALIWAAYWTLFAVVVGCLFTLTVVVGMYFSTAGPSTPNEWIQLAVGLSAWVLALVAVLVLAPWAAAVIVWRWQRVGAILLLVEGSLLPILVGRSWPSVKMTHSAGYGMVVVNEAPAWMPLLALLLLLAAAPPVAAGILFLVSWWKSRPPAPPQPTE